MNEGNGHILSSFDTALREVRDSVLKMASIAQQNLENAVVGLLKRNRELCGEAIAEDDEVDNFERSIDRDGFELLIRFNPVAGDLREVLSGMKVANNLERISDESESIARHARKILKQPEIPENRKIEPLYTAVSDLVRDSIRSYSDGDVELSLSVKAREKALEKSASRTTKELTKAIDGDSGNAKTFLLLIFIVRSLERIGDHAKNIAEDAIFVEVATDIRHMNLEEATAEVEEVGA